MNPRTNGGTVIDVDELVTAVEAAEKRVAAQRDLIESVARKCKEAAEALYVYGEACLREQEREPDVGDAYVEPVKFECYNNVERLQNSVTMFISYRCESLEEDYLQRDIMKKREGKK